MKRSNKDDGLRSNPPRRARMNPPEVIVKDASDEDDSEMEEDDGPASAVGARQGMRPRAARGESKVSCDSGSGSENESGTGSESAFASFSGSGAASGSVAASGSGSAHSGNDASEGEGSGEESGEESDAPLQTRGAAGGKPLDKNSIPRPEVEEADLQRLGSLARYRRIFEPFITKKVATLLSQTAKDKADRRQAGAGDGGDPGDAMHTQPYCLSPNCLMRNYQIEGFSWLVNNYYRSISCILADEMGLGKTLQSIAFIAHMAVVQKLSGPFLVVVPLSVLFNWMQEFKKFCPRLKVLRLHATDKEEQFRLRQVLRDPDVAQVVVTTYDTIKAQGFGASLKRMVWRSVFLDEGHRIKNEDSDVSKACYKLKTRFRVVLTGTPVQNNLHEFGALLRFLSPNIFTDLSLFDGAFDLNNGADQIDRALLANAHYLMKPFVLRRLKSEVETKLPPKVETKINCPMSETQSEVSRLLLLRDQDMLTRIETGSAELTVGQASAQASTSAAVLTDKSRLMSLLAQLRKAANHPFLFPGIEKVAIDGRATEEIVSLSGKMKMLDRMLGKLYEKGHRVVLFSQFTRTLDIISDYLDMRGYRHTRLDGQTNRVMREVRINFFNKEKSPMFVFCLSTRAGGEGVNLFTADTVILFDSDWNPQVDIQAMARVHRIGQTKVVHVYRLVTAGSVEECIVQRQQRKLFLDNAVNRGSTKNAEAEEAAKKKDKKDKKRAGGSGDDEEDGEEGDEEEEEEEGGDSKDIGNEADEAGEGFPGDEPEPSKVFQAVRFGWNSVFSANQSGKKDISDEDLERLLDRKRGIAAADDVGGTLEHAEDQVWQENQQSSLETFDELVPMLRIDNIRSAVRDTGEQEAKTVEAAGQEGEGPSSGALVDTEQGTVEEGAAGGSSEMQVADAVDAPVATPAFEVEMAVAARPKRTVQSRTVEVYVEGLGMVPVSRASMGVDDDAAKSKAFIAREARQKASQSLVYVTNSGRQVAGRDFNHQDVCQQCWDGGELIVCDLCPMSYHLKCLGLKRNPKEKRWMCPHHYCHNCNRRSGAATLLFRCEVCPQAFCEDCLPAESEVQGESERLQELGFRMTQATCFILCSPECQEFFHDEVSKEQEAAAPHQTLLPGAFTVSQLRGTEGADEGGESPQGGVDAEMFNQNLSHALDACSLPDIRQRLGYEFGCRSSYLHSRFSSLSEIPNLDKRLQQTHQVSKLLLLRLCHGILKFQEELLQGGAGTDGSPSASASADLQTLTDQDQIDKAVCEFAGASPKLSEEQRSRVFLHAVRDLANARKTDFIALARILGVVLVCPIRSNTCKEGSEAWWYEPKFNWVSTFNREIIEEAVVAMLVLPSPQNMLLQRNQGPADKLPRNLLPPHSLLYCARLLQALGECCEDDNRNFFTSLETRKAGMEQLRSWTPSYPGGGPSYPLRRMEWLAAAARLWVFLSRPAVEDKRLETALRTTYQHFHPPRGQSKAANPQLLKPDSDAVEAPSPTAADAEAEGDEDSDSDSYSDQSDSDDDDYSQEGGREKPRPENAIAVKENVSKPSEKSANFMRWLQAEYSEELTDISGTASNSDAAGGSLSLSGAGVAAIFDAQIQKRQRFGTFTVHAPERAVMLKQVVVSVLASHPHLSPAMLLPEHQEAMRRCEFELYLAAKSKEEYEDEATLVARVASVLHTRPMWRGTLASVDGAAAQEPPLTPQQEARAWRRDLTKAMREDVMAAVSTHLAYMAGNMEKRDAPLMSTMAQHYEMGLCACATSMALYLDRATVPARVVALINAHNASRQK